MQNTATKTVELPALKLGDQDHGAKDGRPTGGSFTPDNRTHSAEDDRVEYGAGDGRPVVAGARRSG